MILTYKLGDFYVSFLVFLETEFIEMPCIPAMYLIHERRIDETHDFFSIPGEIGT
jgi:hypothetical protein